MNSIKECCLTNELEDWQEVLELAREEHVNDSKELMIKYINQDMQMHYKEKIHGH